MAITRGVKSTRQDLSAAVHATSWGTAPTAGQKVLVWVWGGTTTAPTSVVDNGSPQRTYVLGKAAPGTGIDAWIYYADDVRPSGTYTVTVTWAASQFGSCFGYSYDNVASGGPTATNSNTGTGLSISSNAVTSAANSIYAASYVNDGGAASTQTYSGGFTKEDSLEDGTSFTEGSGADLINATGSQTATVTNQFTRPNLSMGIAVWPEVAAGTASIAYGYGPN